VDDADLTAQVVLPRRRRVRRWWVSTGPGRGPSCESGGGRPARGSSRLLTSRYTVIRRSLARAWRTDLPRVVLLVQVGNAFNWLGYGLILRSRSSTCTNSAASRRPPPVSCLRRSSVRAPWQRLPRERCSTLPSQVDPDRRQSRERDRFCGPGVRRPAVAAFAWAVIGGAGVGVTAPRVTRWS